jgi:hypothetical protein
MAKPPTSNELQRHEMLPTSEWNKRDWTVAKHLHYWSVREETECTHEEALADWEGFINAEGFTGHDERVYAMRATGKYLSVPAPERRAGSFDRQSNRGTRICRICGKRRQEANIDFGTGNCNDCNDAAGLENEHQDGYHDGEPGTDGWRLGPNADCSMCKAEAQYEEGLRIEHKKGMHAPLFSSDPWSMGPHKDCATCVKEFGPRPE